MIPWQDGLEKKKAELDGRLKYIGEKEKSLCKRLRTIEEEMGIQEECSHELELQLREKQEAISNLVSKIAEMEKILENLNR